MTSTLKQTAVASVGWNYLSEQGYRKKIKAVPVTSHGGPQGCEMSRLPYFLDSQLTYGGEAVKPYAPAALYPQEDSWYSFLLQAESTPGL
jgi:hypothetical protein